MSDKRKRDEIPLESAITASIQRWLSKQPCWWGFKVAGGGAQMRGVPDIVGCWRGVFVGLEVKRPEVGHVSELQKHRIEQIRDAGGVAEVVYSLDDVKRVCEALDGCERIWDVCPMITAEVATPLEWLAAHSRAGEGD